MTKRLSSQHLRAISDVYKMRRVELLTNFFDLTEALSLDEIVTPKMVQSFREERGENGV